MGARYSKTDGTNCLTKRKRNSARVIVLYLQILLRQIWFASRHHQIKVVQSFWRRLMHFSQPSVDNARTQRKRDDFQQGGRKKRRVKSIVYYKSRGTRSIIRRKNFRECSELCLMAVDFANVIVKCIKKGQILLKALHLIKGGSLFPNSI